ncbi:hypothetical protein BIW11_01596 [Tropilaelaps mercedesae]|uniref:Uncharacterized protein n=1 Tax=Tropilaelaps mercedesae TaxID=418985 RepID=A0A1V9XBP8_9ACAR|nr:hypothetical protein BIW11_01596 [Tropilaelaps mercedesae]
MSRSFLRGLSLLKASARFTPLSYQSRRNGYFVLLPEVPDDTSETNILMRTYDKVPQYANITADTAYRAVGKLIIEFESGLCHLEERLEDPNYPKTFESVFEPIEKLSLPLEWAWMAVRNLFLVRNDEQISRVYYKLQKRVSTAFSRKFSSPQIYRVVRDLHGDIDKYDGDQQQGVCNILEKFFGIELREIQSKEPLWAPDVKVFEVAIDGKEVGTILMDLPSRGDKYPGSWCHSLKMSRARYLEVSGLAYVPWDTSQTVPELFNMLLLDKRFARMLCAEERLPDDYHKKIIDRRLHMGSVDLQQEIYLSLLDLELYSTNEFWQDVVRRLKPKLITAVPFHEQDVYHVCSFSDIISGVMGASYYTKVWSRMIAAEVFYTMQKCQNETDTINVARRFRDNILIDGGYVTPVQAFRKFCGRDPEADSLLAVMKLQEEPI